MLRSPGGPTLVFGALVLLGVGAMPVVAQAMQTPEATLASPSASDLQEILLELRIGRLASRTVGALTDGSTAYLPVSELLTLGEVDHTMAQGGVLRAVLHPGSRLVVLDPLQNRASREGRPVAVAPDGMAVRDGALFASGPLLESLFDVIIRTDWSQLTSTVMDPESLPLGRRVAREAHWRNIRGPSEAGPSQSRLDLEQGRLGGAVLDWSFSSNVDQPSISAYSVGAGARLFGGGLQLSARSLGPVRTGEHRVDATYQTVWSDRTWITQMRLGDGFSSGPRLRSMRGVALTNAPFLRRSFFGMDSFSGRVGAGWDVELRRSDQTLDVARADEQGAFALDIPLSYGENSIQVVAFGPHGEVVTTERLVLLGTDRIPAGSFEWGLSGGDCRDQRCSGTANVDLRYGLSDRWTVRGGMEGFTRDTLESLVQPYLGVSGTLLPGLQVSSEALSGGFLRGGLTYAPSSRIRARGVYTAFSSAIEEPVLHDAGRRSTTEVDLLLRPLASQPRWMIRAAVLRQDLGLGTLSLMQAASSLQVGNVTFEAGLRRTVDEPELGGRWSRDFQNGAVTALLSLPGQRKLWTRAEVELADASAFHRIRGRLAYQVSPGARLEVGSGWNDDLGSDFTVTFSTYLSQLRSLTQAVASTGDRTRVTQVGQGSVHWNEATGQMTLSPGPGLERGGISGYVFLDENGNGAFDPGERGVGRARVVIGGRTVTTDSAGRHDVWDLLPFEPVRIWVDPMSIEDPRMVPLRDHVEVVVPPASYGRVDLALTPSQEIWGSVVLVTPGGDRPLAYAELELVDLATGEGRPVRAFSDGGFYESGIKPGRYELRVTPGSLRGLGVEAAEGADRLEVLVTAGGEPPAPILVRLVTKPVAGGAR